MDNSFHVQGMTCGHCELAVKKAVAHLDPEAKIEIDRESGKVDVHSTKSREDIARVIANEGYQVV
jgi:copper chaperone